MSSKPNIVFTVFVSLGDMYFLAVVYFYDNGHYQDYAKDQLLTHVTESCKRQSFEKISMQDEKQTKDIYIKVDQFSSDLFTLDRT